MKHLIAILAVFLLLGSQTSAQETIPAPEYLETLPEFTLLNKPVVCGPTKAILDKIAEFNETPAAAWIDAERGDTVMFYINENTGTTTIVEQSGEIMCIISQGMGGVVVAPPKKLKGCQ